MTELMQAHRQWMSRAPDERFTSLIDMQDFKCRLRDNSRSQVISSRGLNVRPVEDDPRALQIMGYGNGLPAAAPTHWSFGQLCSLASPGNSPASYFRETQMPAPIIADCLNYNLRFTRGVEGIGILLTTNEDGGVNELRSVNGPNYGRIYDAEVVDTLVEKFGDGVSGQWRVPGEFGQRVAVTKDNTTLYASDRDMFVFLADEENRIELPNRRAGRSGSFARGFFVWNSEVGKTTLGAGFDYVCCTGSSGAQTSTPKSVFATPRALRTGGSRRSRPCCGNTCRRAQSRSFRRSKTRATSARDRPRPVPRQPLRQECGARHQSLPQAGGGAAHRDPVGRHHCRHCLRTIPLKYRQAARNRTHRR